MELESLTRLTRDVKQAAVSLSPDEARYLVDYYYLTQEDRKRATNQERSLVTGAEPHLVVSWLAENASILERNIKSLLNAYTDTKIVGRWAKSIMGIGPILSAGLLAHIDIERAPTVGHIWRFAGLDPTVTWEKKTKRPWNASLKTLSWKVGESFVKVSNHPEDVYGKLYQQRKALELERNAAGLFATQAAEKLRRFKIGKDTEAYKAYSAGLLPPAHLHARAKRWAVKLFLAHYHAVAYRDRFGVDAPKPYVISQLGHAHEIPVPQWPW